MNGFFITGTDTGIGKTLVSAIVTSVLKASYWKPIQSGIADEMPDMDQVRLLTGFDLDHFPASNYMLQASLSPDQAAELENVEIDIKTCQIPPIVTRYLVVEGAGGVYVPLNQHECILDLIQQVNLPVIIVSRGILSTVNHTLLTIAALRQRKIPIHGVVYSGKLNPANQIAIEKWGDVKTLFHVPHFENVTKDLLTVWLAQHKKKILESLL
jgi:dethiobiotin synthetase